MTAAELIRPPARAKLCRCSGERLSLPALAGQAVRDIWWAPAHPMAVLAWRMFLMGITKVQLF